ncbi:hypothetical protein PspKH34_33630 [Parageobacillus sp. KH3-4]|nr:putative phage protein [Parageobacillus thermoglucosidasius TNO-09.020]BDG48802.1 hypothetical protein PspKH34_33630 [Parageobacillus sp. KH3-4]
MCKLCNGTHVVHEINSFSVGFAPCPECGPMPEEKFQVWIDDSLKRIELAENYTLRIEKVKQ